LFAKVIAPTGLTKLPPPGFRLASAIPDPATHQRRAHLRDHLDQFGRRKV
jgi:hypothetical protein